MSSFAKTFGTASWVNSFVFDRGMYIRFSDSSAFVISAFNAGSTFFSFGNTRGGSNNIPVSKVVSICGNGFILIFTTIAVACYYAFFFTSGIFRCRPLSILMNMSVKESTAQTTVQYYHRYGNHCDYSQNG